MESRVDCGLAVGPRTCSNSSSATIEVAINHHQTPTRDPGFEAQLMFAGAHAFLRAWPAFPVSPLLVDLQPSSAAASLSRPLPSIAELPLEKPRAAADSPAHKHPRGETCLHPARRCRCRTSLPSLRMSPSKSPSVAPSSAHTSGE